MIEQAFANFSALTQAEKIEFLNMILEHKDLLYKVLPDAPLIKYLVTGQGPEDNPLIQAYQAWVASLLTRPL
jgi:hypothetical protein